MLCIRAQSTSPRICSIADIWIARIRAPSLSWKQSTGLSIFMIYGGFEAWILDIIFTRDCFFSFRTLATSIMELPSESFYSNRNENNRSKTSIRKKRRSFCSCTLRDFNKKHFPMFRLFFSFCHWLKQNASDFRGKD